MSRGIYAICHTPSGRAYVGSALNFERRWAYHRWCLRAGRHDNKPLQEAWSSHGGEEFTFVVLESTTHQRLSEREQWWIDSVMTLGNGFNVARFANSTRGRKKPPRKRKEISA